MSSNSRSERRLGEMVIAQKETVGLNGGGRPVTGTHPEPVMMTIAQ